MSLPLLRLLRWLGPWADRTRVPAGVSRREVVARASCGEPLRIWVYAPERRAIRGSLIFVHGTNPFGPADPRSDRFTRVLASAGFLVCAPFLRDFITFDHRLRVADDLERAFPTCVALPEHPRGARPALLSLSVGSLPALRLAGNPRLAGAISGVGLFGGYCDPEVFLRFALGLDGPRPAGAPAPDLMVLPALAIILTRAERDDASQALRAAGQAWRRFMEDTWGREEMRRPELHGPLLERLAAALEPEARATFLRGCGRAHDSAAFFEATLRASKLDPLEVRPWLPGVRCPVRLMHGRGDRIIPHTELDALQRALPASVNVRVYRSGLFEHTRGTSLAGLLRMGPALARETRTLLGMARAIVELGCAR